MQYEFSGLKVVVAIVIISYLVGMAARLIPKIKNEYIPVIVGVAGGLLGALGLYFMPDFPANDILNAIAIGIVSGFASTGVNQAYFQLFCKGKECHENE